MHVIIWELGGEPLLLETPGTSREGSFLLLLETSLVLNPSGHLDNGVNQGLSEV